MGDALVRTEHEGPVVWLTLNQGASRNPLSSKMIASLTETLASAYADDSCRVIVLAADGPVFSAGHDLKEMHPLEEEDKSEQRQRIADILENCAALMQGIVQAPKPVIACVQGTATAAGCQLVSACDLAVASSDAHFCTPGVNVGAFCTTPLVGIGRNLSRKHAMEMALTGDMFSADEAIKFGLINRHVPSEALREETAALAHKIASRSAQSIRGGKAAFYRQIEMPLADAFEYANQVMLEGMAGSDDAEEGRLAFIEKRSPVWHQE
ncbi:MAG: enoyl-CoA hydratase [Luminiphilus sp.]|nr:enoyl-CoA hydratase [Luminiphilus sp.]